MWPRKHTQTPTPGLYPQFWVNPLSRSCQCCSCQCAGLKALLCWAKHTLRIHQTRRRQQFQYWAGLQPRQHARIDSQSQSWPTRGREHCCQTALLCVEGASEASRAAIAKVNVLVCPPAAALGAISAHVMSEMQWQTAGSVVWRMQCIVCKHNGMCWPTSCLRWKPPTMWSSNYNSQAIHGPARQVWATA